MTKQTEIIEGEMNVKDMNKLEEMEIEHKNKLDEIKSEKEAKMEIQRVRNADIKRTIQRKSDINFMKGLGEN